MSQISPQKVLTRSIATILGGIVLLAISPSTGHAAAVTFGAATNIVNDSDVFNAGATVFGYNYAAAPVSLNGVTFTTIPAVNAAATLIVPGSGTTSTGLGAAGTGWTQLSADYKRLLDGCSYGPDNGPAGSLTLNNLTAGHVYALQYWVNDSRAAVAVHLRTLTISDGLGNASTLKYINGTANGGLGQYVMGGFTADGTTQALTLTAASGAAVPKSSVQMNASQLRDVTGVWSGEVSGVWDATSANFTGGLNATQVAALTGNVYFADTTGFRTAITAGNTTVTIPNGGVTATNVFLQNGTVPYIFNTTDGTGIKGTANLIKTGAGAAFFTGNNTYTGTTTISGGVLAVASLANGGLASGLGQSSSAAANLVFGGGVLRYTGLTTSTDRNFTILPGAVAGIEVEAAGTVLTLTGSSASSTGGFLKNGGGTLVVAGTNLYTGSTVVNAGILRPTSGAALGVNSALSMNAAAILDLNGNNLTFGSGTGTGTGSSITDQSATAGTSTLTFANQGAASVPTSIQDGAARQIAVAIANANAGGTMSNVSNNFSGGLTLLNSAAGTKLIPINGAVGAPGAITNGPFGKGAITVGLLPTDKAGLHFNAAGVTLMNNLVINTSLGTDLRGIRVDSTGEIISGSILAKSADLMFSTNGTGAVRVTGAISSGASPTGLATDNTGTAIGVTLANISGTPNSYTGNTVFTSKGTLILGAADQIPDGAGKGNLVLAGKFQLAGFNETINGLSGAGEVDGLNGTPTLTVGANDATGTANTFTGAIKNTAGTLALMKTGSGILTLGGALTYTGATTVNQGTLSISSGLTSSTVTVNSGGILGGTGTVGAATINTGGTVAGGALGVGMLTLNSLSFGGAGAFGIANLAAYTNTPAVNVTGTLDFGSNNATIRVGSLAGIALNTPYKIATYGALANGTTANFVLGALPARGAGVLNNTAGAVTLTVTGTDSIKWTGAGTPGNVWDTTTQNWKLASNNSATAYINTSPDQVIFDDSAVLPETVVNLSVANVTPSNVSFANSATNYTLQGAFGIAGSTAVTKAGTGLVTLNTANTYTGATIINEGALNVRNANALGATTGSTTVNAGGALQLQGGVTLAGETLVINGTGNANNGAIRSVSGDNVLTGVVDLASNASLHVDANTLTLAPTAVVSGVGNLIKTGPGKLIVTGTNTYAGITTISEGTVQVGNGGVAGVLSAGTIVNNANLVFFRTDSAADHNPALAISGTGQVTYQGPTVPTSGTGLFLADDSNSYSGGTTIANARLRVTTGDALGTGSVNVGASAQVYVTGAIAVPNNFTIGGSGWTEATGALGAIRVGNGATVAGAIAMAGNARLSSYDSSGTFSGPISGNANLEIFANGTGNVVTLSGDSTFVGSTTITNATLQIGAGGTTGSLAAGPIVNNGVLTVNRVDATTLANAISGTGSFNTIGTGTVVMTGANSYAGTTTIGKGTLEVAANGAIASANQILVTGTAASPATLNVIGGTVATTRTGNQALYVGGAAGTSGVINLSSGSILLNGPDTSYILGDFGNSVFNQTGGTFVAQGGGDGWMGNNGNTTTATSTLNVSGGTFTQQTNFFHLGTRSNATINISGTGQVSFAAFQFGANGVTNNPQQIVNLDGGSLKADFFVKASGTSTFNFNGGTLKAGTSTTTFMNGLNNAVVKIGGAYIDTNGFDITIGQALTHDSSLGDLDGGLTKRGAGTLTVTGNNTYNGPTVVEAGTLNLAASLAGSPITVKAGGTLNVAANVDVAQLINVESGGTFSPGVGPASAFASGGLAFLPGSKSRFDLDGAEPQLGLSDIVYVAGDLTLDGVLTVSETSAGSFLSGTELNDRWTLFSYTGSLTNNGLDLSGMPSLNPALAYSIDLSVPGEVGLKLTAVPEPASCLTLLAGLGVLLGVRRPRRS